MKLSIFTNDEAARVAWKTSPATLALQLHQWEKHGDLVRVRRGVYAFPESMTDCSAIARILYPPAYISLESALHHYGLMPDVVFAVTLMTPRGTRRFRTPFGPFIYHHCKKSLFWGYDPDTLMAHREKALVDYCYLYRHRLQPHIACWEALRWQHLESVNFRLARAYSKKTGIDTVRELVKSLAQYGTT